jgi:hypothetical protein
MFVQGQSYIPIEFEVLRASTPPQLATHRGIEYYPLVLAMPVEIKSVQILDISI